jgi:hypothetical protein
MTLAEPLDRSVLSALRGFAATLSGGLGRPVTGGSATSVLSRPATTV